jgi:uncharacterized protein
VGKFLETDNPTLLVPLGTQIVTLIETKIFNQNRFHPPGAVAVITGQPQDVTHSYIVRFPDGTEASLKRYEFAVHKHFKREQISSGAEENDYRRFVIYRCVVGSRAFGLDDENSDTDVRGIYLPPARLHWSLFGVPEQLENHENQECFWELQKFLILALKANPNILECLCTPLVEFADETAQELLKMRGIFFSKLVYQTYNGYVLSQFKKLEQDLRTRGEIRWKHAMHLIRLLLQGIEILENCELNVRVGENRDQLLAIKRGEIEWNNINEWRLALHKDFDAAFRTTKLPDRPDYEKANEFLIEARRGMVNNV